MKNPSLQLLIRLFWIYTAVALFGVILITLNNLYINGFSWEELTRFNIKAKLFIALLCIVSLLVLSYIKLRHVLQFIDDSKRVLDIHKVWHRLMHFPNTIFYAMLVFGIIVSPTYHLIDKWIKGNSISVWGRYEFLLFMRDFLFDQSLTLTLAVLFYSLIRHCVRSYLLKLPIIEMNQIEWKTSFIQPLLINFISIILITIFSMLWYVLNSIALDTEINMIVLFGTAFITFAFGFCLFLILSLEFRRELQLLIYRIRSLIGGDRMKLHGKMPIISRDEIGQLALAFNELQSYVAKEYAELQYELHLAYKVQQNLLPKEKQSIGRFHIHASCQPMKEVGGDLYDIQILDGDRFALLIGDVSGKGMSAALLMSAMMVLFKTEMRRGGSAGEVLTRLNRLMVETLRGEMYITLGLAIFDQKKESVEYASAGHVAPYLIHDGRIEQILISSLPLGFSMEEEYNDMLIPYQYHDRLIFYTDGVVEKVDVHGDFIGFDRFEQFLHKLDDRIPLDEQLRQLLLLLGEGTTARYEDDRTLIMVRSENTTDAPILAKAGEREWSMIL